MIKIAAFNDNSDDNGSEEEISKEALKQIAFQEYARALEFQRRGNISESIQLLRDLLDTELLSDVQETKSKDEQVSRPLFNLKYLCYKNLASALQVVGDFDASIEAYTRASELDDTDITLWHRLGDVSMQAKNYETALYAFQRGIERNPRHWPCLDKLILLLLGLKYFEQCISYIHDALQLDPGYMRGLVYRKYIYTVYRHMGEYMAYINPVYAWNEAHDESIEECLAEQLIKEAEEIQEISTQQQRDENIIVTIPKLILEKPIRRMTWKYVGESLIHMHKYITENGLSHASHIEIIVDEEEIVETVEESVTDSEKTSVRKRCSAVTSLERWEWCSRRKSGRKKPDNSETLYDRLYELVPPDLVWENSQNKKQIDESLDMLNLEAMFDEKANVSENEYFGKIEEEDVKSYLDKCIESTKDIIDLLNDYLYILSKKYKLKWPEGLPEVFIEANNCYNNHIDIPTCTDENSNELVHYVYVNLLAQELIINKKFNTPSDKELIHGLDIVEAIEFIVSQKPDIFSESVCVEMTLRILWLKAHTHSVNKCDDFMLQYLYLLMEEFYAMGEDRDTYCLCLINFTYNTNIQEREVIKYVKALERNMKLAIVTDLYSQNNYDEVLTILIEYFEQCKELAAKQDEKMSLDFATQIYFIIESYWALNKIDSCLKWSFICLHEALEIYFITLSVVKENERWSQAINKILCSIEHIIDTEGLFCLDMVLRNELCQGVNDLIRMASHQIETTASSIPFDTILPWIILHYILQREEDENRIKKVEDHDISSTDKNTVACDEVPIPLEVLFIAHKELGDKFWCSHSDGKLLNFIMDNLVHRLRSPVLAKSLPQINRCLEQCVYCLYGLSARKAKSKLIDHKTTANKLDWNGAQQIYEIFRPTEMPMLTGKVAAITIETEALFQRILSLIPAEYDLSKYVTEAEKYINCVEDRLPSVPPLLPYKMRDIYFFLGDFYFKKKGKDNSSNQALKYNLLDLVINNDRFLSWAEIALTKSNILDKTLKLCESFDDENFLNAAKSAMRCFKRSVSLDPKMSYLRVKYGTFVYRVHSFCSRLLKQASESLSMGQFDLLQEQQEDFLNITSKCLTIAKNLKSSDSDKSDNWLLDYTLGKVAEKKKDPPSVYLSFYMQSVKSLQETGAVYPTTISYCTPPNLSVEVLELQYRIHASILKYIEQHENKPIPASVGKIFKKYLEEWQCGPFKQTVKKNNDTESDNEYKMDVSSVQPSNILKRSVSDADKDDNQKTKHFKLEAAAKVRRSASYDAEHVTHNESAVTVANVSKETSDDVSNLGYIKPDSSAVVEQESNVSSKDSPDEKQKTCEPVDLNVSDNKDESSSPSSSSSSGSNGSPSDSSSDSSGNSDSSSRSSRDTKPVPEDTKPVPEEEIDKIVSACLDALEDCASRYTPHYKALYRLAHYHFSSKRGRNIEKCKDIMLSTFTSRSGQKIPGLFSGRNKKKSKKEEKKKKPQTYNDIVNFFNNIWRFPSNDVDKPGGFAAHMNRSVLLTLKILKEIDDHNTLLSLSLYLRKNPDKDKKYLRDSDREDLAKQAFSLSAQALKGQVQRFSQQYDIRTNEVERRSLKSLMIDIYNAYDKVRRQSDSRNLHEETSILTNLLVDAYKLIIETPITDHTDLVDLSIKYTQNLKANIDKLDNLPKKQNINLGETQKSLSMPLSQPKPDPKPSTASTAPIPQAKLPTQDMTSQEFSKLSNDFLLAQQALLAYSLQNTLQSYQNSFQVEIYRQHLENYSQYGMLPLKKKRGPKPMKRSLSCGVPQTKALSFSSSQPSSTKAAPAPVITSVQKPKSSLLTPSMGTVLPSLPPSMTASLPSFEVPIRQTNPIIFLPQAYAAGSSSSLISGNSKTASHKQAVPGKTLQEKLVEKYQSRSASTASPKDINASISRLPSSLMITKTSSSKQPSVQGKKPEGKSESRPNPIPSDVVIILDDD